MNKKPKEQGRVMQGTLNLLILQVLSRSPGHGYDVIRRIRESSHDVFQLEEGSLYPALHRLEKNGLLESEWKQSSANRRAKYYRLTTRGRKQLGVEAENWQIVSTAIRHILGTPGPASS